MTVVISKIVLETNQTVLFIFTYLHFLVTLPHLNESYSIKQITNTV